MMTLRQIGLQFLLIVLLGTNAALQADSVLLPGPPALSPDGSEIAFSYAGDIWTVSSGGGTIKRLTFHPAKDTQPCYSPDGKELGFISDREGSSQVYTMPTAGGAPRQVTFHTAGYQLLEWAGDGKTVLTQARRDHHWKEPDRFFLIDVNERKSEQLLFDAYGDEGRLLPDGKQLLFVREGERWWRKGYHGSKAAQIWRYDINEKTFEKILDHPNGCRSPLWKPDGSGFYYCGAESGTFNLREYDFAAAESRELTSFEDDFVVYPCISRDGSVIVFRHLFDLYRLKPEKDVKPVKIKLEFSADSPTDDTLRRAVTKATEGTFTSDGLEMAFAAGGDIWVMDTELKEPVAVTSTEHFESEPLFVQGSQALLFISDEAGQVDIFKATPQNADLYWWQNEQFDIKRITNDAATELNLQLSPDGEHIAFVKKPGALWVTDLEGKHGTLVSDGFDTPSHEFSYDFSPDGKWLVYSKYDNDFNSEIWIAPIDGSREPYNVSRHPDNDFSPAWSPDGKKIAFVGRRSASEWDVYYVFLQAEDNEQSSRDRTLEKALEKLDKARKKKEEKPDPSAVGDGEEKSNNANQDKGDDGQSEEKSATPGEADKKNEEKLVDVQIDFDNLHERVRRIAIPDSTEFGLFWSKDGKTLAFQGTVDGKKGTYSVEIPDRLKPKLVTEKTGDFLGYLDDSGKVAWLIDGTPATLDVGKGTIESYAFTAQQQMSVAIRHKAAFNTAWRLMRDNWYDDRFNNHNWDAIRRKYEPVAARATNPDELTEVVSMMLGELNGSHLGFKPLPAEAEDPTQSQLRPQTAHLGIRFATNHQGPGLLVRDVIMTSPADKALSKIEPGETVLSIDGTAVDPDLDLTTVLNGRLDRDIELVVKSVAGEERQVYLRPISYESASALLYPQFIEETRQAVEELSEGRLGYLHIQYMRDANFLEFERQLYNAGYGKEGLIIDVRENPGGSITDHLLTALTQPRHAATVPRGGGPGYPQDRMVYATWQKPIVVLCNQNSGSNAEIFSHAIKTLKRGKVIGVPTAGAVISTGEARVMDYGLIRQPFRGWFVLGTGQDMELNGAVPHHVVWPEPGELPLGKDRQLEKAIEVLLKDVKKASQKKSPHLIKNSEREME
ncbi:MAG: S41 family peptidase [Planctomycetaceae bacterium]